MSVITTFRLQDSAYPQRLLKLLPAPPKIWMRGSWNEQLPSVAIVGARAASTANLCKATQIAYELSLQGVAIVSGGALGIDAAAHQGALKAKGPTCAILGTGIDVVYPKRHIGLFNQILQQNGCLLSCFPPQAPIERWHFPFRNSLIAALSDMVIVIQAPPSSGSRYTVETAAKLGVPILVLHNAPEVHDLVLVGAQPIQGATDVLSLLELQHSKTSDTAQVAKVQMNLPMSDAHDESAQKLYQALVKGTPLSQNQGQGLAELSVCTGIPLPLCVSTLLELELEGYCFRLPGERYVATAS